MKRLLFILLFVSLACTGLVLDAEVYYQGEIITITSQEPYSVTLPSNTTYLYLADGISTLPAEEIGTYTFFQENITVTAEVIATQRETFEEPQLTTQNTSLCTAGICTITFTTSTDWEVPTGVQEVDVLVVAGGGGGGSSTSFGDAGAGGGGAGGVVYEENYSVTPEQNITIQIGAGGAGAGSGNTPGNTGENSTFGTLTALGGGGGSGGNMRGLAGGSGGGSRGFIGGEATQSTSITGGFGSRGGNHGASPGGAAATGGGGAGGAGEDLAGTSGEKGGDGGSGTLINITGTPTYYGGGGGGGAAQSNTPVGQGGIGGGGDGGNTLAAPTPGQAQTGGGGGGGNNDRQGASGGSGVVIVRYAQPPSPITFVAPTPPNGTVSQNTNTTINVSVNLENITTLIFDWNQTNTSFYSSDLVFMMNLDNVTALGESTSTAIDVSPQAHTGTFFGNAGFTTNGMSGGAATFDGTNDWIQIPDDPSLDDTQFFTFQAWVYDTAADTQPRGIASKRISSGSSRAWSLFVYTSRYLYFDMGSTRVDSGVALPANQWVHVTVTFDGTASAGQRVRFYYDGELVQTTSGLTSIPRQSSASLFIGILNAAYGNGWQGRIDDVRVWEKTLSSGEVQAVYASSLRKIASDNWQFTSQQVNLTEGDYTYQAFVEYINWSSTEKRTLIIGEVASYVLPTPESGTYVNTDAFTVSVDSEVPAANITISLYNTSGFVEEEVGVGDTIAFFTALEDGVYWFNATYDDGDTQLALETRNITVDTLAPTIQYEAGTAQHNTSQNTGSLFVNVSANDINFDELTLTLYQGMSEYDSVSTTNTTLGHNFTSLSDGTYTFNVTATDLAGNTNVTQTRIVTIDTAPPSLTVHSPVSTTYIAFEVLVNMSATDTSGVDSFWFFDETANVSYTSPVNVTLSDGDYAFVFYANDSLGNLAMQAVNFTINSSAIDIFPPLLTINSPQNQTYNSSQILVSFSASDNVAVDSLWFFDETANVSYTSPVNVTLPDGNYTFVFYANDTSDNLVQGSRSFTIDSVFPQVTYGAPTPVDASTITVDEATINVTIQSDPLDEVLFGWGTSRSFFDPAMQLMLNFDNIASLGDSSTIVSDASLYGRNGAITGATYTTGRHGSAMSVPNANDRVDVASFPGLNGQSQATITAWVYQTATTTDQYLLWADGNVLIQFGDTFGTPGSTNLRVRWNLEGNWRNSHTATSVLESNEWIHWAFVFDSGDTKIYKNGVEVYSGSDTQTAFTSSSPTYSFGTRTGAGLQGRFDEVRVWNAALSAPEITEHARTNLARTSSDEWNIISERTGLADGLYTYTTSAQRNANTNTTTQSFTVANALADFTITNTSFETGTEGEILVLNATIRNQGTLGGTALVRFLDETRTQTLYEQNVTLAPLQELVVSMNWTAQIGRTNITVVVDPEGVVVELNETNNEATKIIDVDAWQTYYGTLVQRLRILADSVAQTYNWSVSGVQGNILAVDTDSTTNFLNLQALTRSANGTYRFSDLQEADIALNMTGFNDSINETFSDGTGGLQVTDTFTVFGTEITDVPIVATSSPFATGVFWDVDDASGSTYDGGALVFVTKINVSQTGQFGTYDYELFVPALLRENVGGDSGVLLYLEIT